MDREMGSPRTDIQREVVSTCRCYLHGQRDGIPTDRYTERDSLDMQVLSPWTERWDPHGQIYRERQSPHAGVISMDREMGSPRTDIQRETISTDREA